MLQDAVRGLTGAPSRVPRFRNGTPRIAILGTGFAGLGMAIRLRQSGIESFTIYEKADDVGGTWRDNTYPGAACDVPSHLYSFSFETHAGWTRHFSPQPEILQYLQRCTDRYGLRPHIRFGTAIASATWDDGASVWRLHTETGEEVEADVVVSGLGQLNQPAYPDLPGIDSFRGTTFHSARWDHAHDLTGERIAVIGNGASAVQFVPQIQPAAGQVLQFQRSANWILPKPDRKYGDRVMWAFANVPGLERAFRAGIYWGLEWRFLNFKEGNRLSPVVEAVCRRFLRDSVADEELRAALTPDYPVGCKRILISNDYYPALQAPNARVVTDPIVRITKTGIDTADGSHHDVDTIIYATGFRSTDFLTPVRITGRGGVDLAEVWRDGAEAYLGVTVAGFPNLFLCYGPNTNLGHNSIVFMIERQVDYVLTCLAQLAERDAGWLDVRPGAMAQYNREVQERVHHTVWEAGCHSWYKNDAGKVTNNWPRYTVGYWWDTIRPRFDAYEFGDTRRMAT